MYKGVTAATCEAEYIALCDEFKAIFTRVVSSARGELSTSRYIWP